MAVLGKQKYERVYLPSTEHEPNEADRAWVEIRTALFVSDMVEIRNLDDQTIQGVHTLARLIRTWNFTDEAGNPLPVSVETIDKMTAPDFQFLSNWVQEKNTEAAGGLSNEEKKASTVSSTPETEQPKPLKITVNSNS